MAILYTCPNLENTYTMTKIPEKISRFRLRGTEIKAIGKNFYLYRVTCRWDKEAMKYRKVNLGYVGRVTEDGIVEGHHRGGTVPAPAPSRYSLEFGATWLLRTIGQDLLDYLRRHFGNDAEWMFAVAALRAARHCAFKYIEHYYTVSYLSVVFPGLALSPATLSNRLEQLGTRRMAMVDFMREYIPAKNFYAIFDGTSIICNSGRITDAQRGYSSHGCHDPQVNLMYALAVDGEKVCPVFYKSYPGSVRDVSAFGNMMREMGIETAVILADKGFYSSCNGEELDGTGIPYIMPLRRNSAEYMRTPLQMPGTTGFEGRFMYSGRIIWHWSQPVAEGDSHRYFLYMDETLRHMEAIGRGTAKIGAETGEELRKAQEAQLLYGTFAVKSTLMSAGAVETYRLYKTREDVEQLFDIYKDEEDFRTTGMHSRESMEATLFLNHLSTLLVYKLYERLKEQKSLDKYAASKVCDVLWDVRVTNAGAKWQMEPVPKMSRKTMNAVGLQPPQDVM